MSEPTDMEWVDVDKEKEGGTGEAIPEPRKETAASPTDATKKEEPEPRKETAASPQDAAKKEEEAEAEVRAEVPKEKEPPSELDLVFIVDNTGSMGRWIRSAQENVQRIVRDIVAAEATNVRFALVSYRDHPPQDRTFVTQTHDFTSNVAEMQHWVDEMQANGGGDYPEAVAAALFDASNLSYRPNSTKVAVLIADAPPHGLGVAGDGFPNGCPLGHDPLEITRRMAAMGITIYTVICGNFEGQAFYQGVAQITGGQYIPITSAHLLAAVIVGGAQEEIALEKLMQDAQDTVRAEEEAAGHELEEEELATKLQTMFRKKKVGAAATRKTRFGGEDLPDYEAAAGHYSKSGATLADVRKTQNKDHLSLGGYGGGIDSAPKMKVGAAFSCDYAFAPDGFQSRRMVAKCKARAPGPARKFKLFSKVRTDEKVDEDEE